MEFPTHIIDAGREMHASAKEDVKALNARVEKAVEIENLWRDYLSFVTKGWPMHLISLIEKEAPRLKIMRTEGHTMIPLIEEAYRISKEESERIIRRYPSLLESACRDAGLPLDLDSRHPR